MSIRNQIVAELLQAAGDPDPEDAARISVVCNRYADLLEAELQRPTVRVEVMPGVPELLERLEQEPRAVLGLLTGNLARGAALKLRAGGIDPGRFAVGAYGSDSAHRPALPSPCSWYLGSCSSSPRSLPSMPF